MLAGDLEDGVLRMVEVEVEEDPRPLADHAIAVEANEEPFGKGLRVCAEVGLADELGGIGVRKAGQLERPALRGQVGGQAHVAQVAHGASRWKRSYSFSLGSPHTAHSSPLAGRMMAAPDDSML